jgi:hypothetical protein
VADRAEAGGSVTNLQEQFYDEQRDYLADSPHLRHNALRRRVLGLISDEIDAAIERGAPPTVLEIGGGDGSIAESLLARGLSVTSTEMSAASVERMRSRFRHNGAFRAVYDEDGTLAPLRGEQFGALLFSSVLHHIPDYVTALVDATDGHLIQRGSLISVQDPLWYPRLSKATRLLSNGAFLSWRIFQGELRRGVRTRTRRALRGYSDEELGDAVEYHVVRDGVDEEAIEVALAPRFAAIEIVRYWSSQGASQQRAGEAAGLLNTFAAVASDHRADS